MNRLARFGNACLWTGVVLIAAVTMLAGDKMVMAGKAECTTCLAGCPAPVTEACICSCANGDCNGININLTCRGGTGSCTRTCSGPIPCPVTGGPCSKPPSCPDTAKCSCSCMDNGSGICICN